MQHTVSTTVPTEFLCIKEAASFIGMSPAFLRKQARLGRGPDRARCGKVLVFPVAGLRRYVAAQTEARVPAASARAGELQA
jgi:hypothetical protein